MIIYKFVKWSRKIKDYYTLRNQVSVVSTSFVFQIDVVHFSLLYSLRSSGLIV